MRSVTELANLEGRVAVIIGGAGHLGLACGQALAELGASVALVDLNHIQCKASAEQLSKQVERPIVTINADITDEQQLRSVPSQIEKQFGRMDVVVHAAALVGTSPLEGWTTSFNAQSSLTWRRALEVNLTSAFVLVQASERLLRQSGHGSVVFISSIYGLLGPDMSLYAGTTLGNPAAYAASKGGLQQLARWMATVLAPDIRVNTISPGGVLRGQPEQFRKRYEARTPVRRLATEEDIKGAVAYLSSDLSAYVTGHNLVIDGGFSVW